MSGFRRSAAVLVALCVSASLAACAGESARVTASSAPASSAPATGTWLAVLRVERDPDALDADTKALTDVLGSSLVVSPASCFRGLPSDVDGSSYVLGVIASDRAELDELVGRTDRDPVFRVEVEVLCTD
jgi:hypothetical protein